LNPLETYLDRLQEIRATEGGTPELSYRAALENLLNGVGRELDPALQVTAELADTGAGHPDFGFMERNSGNLRGVVEVKAPEEDTPQTADGSQVARYWQHYGYVLVTNYRDFLLVVRQNNGKARVESRYQLAPDNESFWKSKPQTLAKEHAEAFPDFLAGVMTRSAPIIRAKDLAADLARHAREAKRRLVRHDISALAPLQHAMEQTLGLHFHGDEGQAFFQSSLVQTLFYGLFSGWMLWRRGVHRLETFNWKDASEYLALPLIGDLYEEIARPKRLADLDLREPLEWATSSLNRVDEELFFKTFDADHAITLFYEPFLQAFDPKLRKELGVWYTPPEIVQYMVGRVDQLLRDELGIADGLADDQVYVLDPAAGTGSYLVEVAKTIHRTLKEHGHGSLAAARVKKALCTRIFGFEILPAPYVVAHLQLGVLLRFLGTKLTKDERAEVYLTNALTGWEPPKEPKSSLLFPELEKEAERAGRVKREAPILVILGNPPYNRFAGVAEDEEADLIEPYKTGLYDKWGVRKQLLDDLYIRFFRLGEKRIAEGKGGRGIVAFISNYSWLEGVSHPIMREHLINGFDSIFVDNLHGDRKKSERASDGKTSETVFALRGSSPGIQIGTAITTFVKVSPQKNGIANCFYRDFAEASADKRREALIHALENPTWRPYSRITPRKDLRWTFSRLAHESEEYFSWLKIPEIFPTHYSGLNENRQGALISDDPHILEQRIRAYLNANVSDEEIAELCPPLIRNAPRFKAKETRQTLIKSEERFQRANLVRLAFRPFDDLWVYWIGKTKLLNEKREDFFKQLRPGNLFISASQTGRQGGFNIPTIVNKFGDLHLQDPWSQFFPLITYKTGELGGERIEPNVSPNILERLCEKLSIKPFKDNHDWSEGALRLAEKLFYHALGLIWSPAYRKENESVLRRDWARVPIPGDSATLDKSAELGRQVADLLMPDRTVAGITAGNLRAEIRILAVPTRVDGGNIDPVTDLKVEAGWGFRGRKNAVMCGKGKIVSNKADPKNAVDVFINDKVYWANVPLDVWTMTIGGYPVIKKWLSYREYKVLGRPLKLEEVTYITDVIRRLRALVLLGDELDANYRAVCEKVLTFSSIKSELRTFD
jgi:hypothetical protein